MTQKFDNPSKELSAIKALALMVLPITTFTIGYVAEKPLTFLVGTFVFFAAANFLFALTSAQTKQAVGFTELLLQLGRGFSSGITLVGQLGCVGFLILWFI